MATEAEVKQALRQLQDYWPKEKMSVARLAIYAAQLQRLDGGVLADAVKRCLTTLTWMPKLNEIFKIANELPVKYTSNPLIGERQKLEDLYWHEGVFLEEDWLRLIGIHRRLDNVHQEKRVTERMNNIKEVTR